MKSLSQKLVQSKNKLGTIYQCNQQIGNIGSTQEIQDLQQSLASSKAHNKKQSYAERQQNISILQVQKPIIEFDIQISRDYSDKMVIFADSTPEELVEEFIVYNRMRPQSFSPILVSVLEKMKEVENEKDICFTNLREEKYYQKLMKKQQQLCQEYQNVKDLIEQEKQRGQQLINLKLSRLTHQSETTDAVSQSPPQKDMRQNKQDLNSQKSSARGIAQQLSPYQEVSQYPQDAYSQNKEIDRTPSPSHNDYYFDNEPLQVYYDHLNPTNLENTHNIYHPSNNPQKKTSQTPKTQKPLENSKKMQRSTPSPSPPPLSYSSNKSKNPQKLKFIKNGQQSRERSNSPINPKSPLKYPNEQSYLDKSEKRKNYYNHSHELIDPQEVSERLHKMRTEPPCSRYEPKEDMTDKECTFKPQINENSRALSKVYHQKQNAKKPKSQPGQENEEDLSQPHRSKSRGKAKAQNNAGNGDTNNQSGDATIYQIVNSDQLKSSHHSQSQKVFEDFPEQEQSQIIPENLHQSPQYQPTQYQEMPSSSSSHINNSAQKQFQANPITPYNYMPQKPQAPVYEKQINIREEIIYQHPEKIYQPQRISKLKQMQEHSMQTSEFIQQSNDTHQQTSSIPFDPNLNQNYFKYIEMRDEMEKEKLQNNPPLHLSFSKQQQPLKKSMGLQTSEQSLQSKFNKSASIKTSEMETERKPIDFDPNLNNNYFKYLEMRDDIEKEQKYIVTPLLQSFSQQTSQQLPMKKSMGMQTSEFNKSSSIKTSDMQSERQPIHFDPNLNQNYFKYLQMEEDKEREREQLPQFAPQQSSVLQSKAHFPTATAVAAQSQPPPVDKRNISLQTSDYLMFLKSQQQRTDDGASDKENNYEETPKQFVPFDPHLNKNYFKFLQMEEDKQRDDPLLQYLKSNGQSSVQSNDDRSSQQSYNHINRKKYDDGSTKQSQKQSQSFDPNLNKNIFNQPSMPNSSNHNDQLDSYKQDQQEEQPPQMKQFPEEINSPLKRSPKSYRQPSSPHNNNQNNSSIASIPSISDQNQNFKQNGSIYYCDEDPITLQSDDPFITNSQKQLQLQINKEQESNSKSPDFRTNLHKSHQAKPKDNSINQKPDIAISSVRSVSPRIDKTVLNNSKQQVSPNNNNLPPNNQQFEGKGQNNNLQQFNSRGLQMSQSHSNLFQSKLRGQITEVEQEALEEVYKTMKTLQKGYALKKADVDFYNLPFEIVLRSHIEMILKNIQENEDITLQAFFLASEKSQNLSLFLNECVDFLKKKKQNHM